MTDENVRNIQRLLVSAIRCAQDVNQAALSAVMLADTKSARANLAYAARVLADLERINNQFQSAFAS